MSNNSVRWAFNFSKWNPSYADLLLATSCIQNEEKERLARFVFKKDFKSSLIGRLMMRKFINETTGRKYDEIRFVRDAKGKPHLVDECTYTKVNYNVSHQGDFTVLAGVRGDSLLGVDVCKVESLKSKNLNEYFRVMSKTFSCEEWECIRNAGDERYQLAMFYRHWCLKESYLKAVGTGITVNLRDVRFKINTKMLDRNNIINDTEVFFKDEKQLWEFQETLLDDEHCVAVAFSSQNNVKVTFEEISYDSLMKNAVPFLSQDAEYCNDYFKKLEKV